MGNMVVFWSPWHGQARVTANMGAVACLLNCDSGERVVLSHSQFGMSDLEGMFNFRLGAESRKTIYEGSGLSALILRVKQSWVTEEVIEQSLLPVTSSGLYLLPGTEENYDVLRESDTRELVYALLSKDIKEHYEWVFVDASAGNNSLSMRLVDAADVAVINLSQNMATWDRFFAEYPALAARKNVVFVVGGYDADSRYNRRNMVRMYPLLSKRNTGVVPHCTGYSDAISEGAVARFIYANEAVKKGEENCLFIRSCREIAGMIRNAARKAVV